MVVLERKKVATLLPSKICFGWIYLVGSGDTVHMGQV